ncbi:hypothetical protein ADIARSV_2295 [Arcticibacter svalbardensis MN12-7]|uniref:Mrr-like domain-containing protein n=1 Tax=Arcticibacter svalbardensis MN12-7 TaxID=1150600 RepID=R9GS55_9SPHI|nr:hypothetical protein [Arcticibacter svalbardensis]EOR94533.1 hypothetical protein ADIARSV_2295 [Arcticibacter svalbardensis MN12-7]
MISSNNMNTPKNWQDFETLCLKLWGEIWSVSHEIEFNSDNAQGQKGVDIYFPVEGGRKYIGIQCKNKKLNLIDGSPNRITISDVQKEIDKALHFKPALHKLIVATSLQKDQKVEEFVREKSVEHATSGLFSIQICFWDFFERKLTEFPKTYDWYLKNENFHRIGSAKVVFSVGSDKTLYQPKFQQSTDRFIIKKPLPPIQSPSSFLFTSGLSLGKIYETQEQKNRVIMRNFNMAAETYPWHQNVWFKLTIINTGQRVIEDFKLNLDFQGDFLEVGSESPPSPLFNKNFKTDIREYSNSNDSLYIKPFEKSIVQRDSYTSRSIYLKPKLAVESDVVIRWKLLARDFEDEGTLLIQIRPLYYLVSNEYEVDTLDEEKVEVTYSLINRPGIRNMLDNQIQYSDDVSDYTFVNLESSIE